MDVPGRSPSASGRPVTLREVAAAAAVSVSTAARVLRGESYPVDPALRERVQEVARILRYVPNVMARNLRRGVPTTVGLVVGNMLEPYYAVIAQTVTEAAESSQSALAIVCNMQRDPMLELKYCRRLWEHRVAGLVLAGGLFDQWTHRLELIDLIAQMSDSRVIVTTLSPRGLGGPVFSADNYKVGVVMATHLLGLGHRNVGILLGPAQSEVAQQRLAGAVDRLAAEGVGHRVLHLAHPAAAAEDTARRLAGPHPELSGFIVGSDSLALSMLDALRALGRAEPPAASIVGVGNTRGLMHAPAALASVEVGLAACARAAMENILARVGNRQVPEFTEPKPYVVVR
jgi:LacI family transcriptional regulator